MPALGAFPLGREPLGSSTLHDPPVVDILTPIGTISSGGPTVTVSWTFTQPQGDLQGLYRIVFLTDGGTEVAYDTGWLVGTSTSVDVDLVANGVPTDTTDLELQVWARTLSQPYDGYDTEPLVIEWGVPHVTITQPTDLSVFETPSDLNVAWVFTDDRIALNQGSYRVVLRSADNDVTLYDTGWTVDTIWDITLPYILLDQSTYEVVVQLANENGVRTSPVYVTISVDLGDVADYPVLNTVGRVYEVAINGVGYMLAETPEDGPKWQRGTIDLVPDRLATSSTPFSEAIERYNFATTEAGSAGAGQRYANREDSVATGFWDSEGIDPFTEPGTLKLLHAALNPVSTTLPNPRIAVVGDTCFVQTGADTLEYSNGGSWTDLTGLTDTTGPVIISDLTSDGQFWYAATGRSIIRGYLANPGADWSALDAVKVQWAAGRVMAALKEGGSSTPNMLASLSDAGLDENTPLGVIILDPGQTIGLGGTAGGFYFFSASAGSTGQVYAWKLGLDNTGGFFSPFVAWDLPGGYTPAAIATAGGDVWVMAYSGLGATAGRVVLYRGVVGQDGAITPFFVAELSPPGGATDLSECAITTTGDLVFFSWPGMTAAGSGIGAVSLVTGGYAKWFQSSNPGAVTDVAIWQGKACFTVAGVGLFVESLTQFVPSGSITSSVTDAASTLSKVWDSVTVTSRPVGAGESIVLFTSLDDLGSFTELGRIDTPGVTKQEFPFAKKADRLAIRLIMAGTGDTSPIVTLMQGRYHALGLSDRILILPIDCGDNLTGLNGHPLPENKIGAGAVRARYLETLSQTRVQVQDIDWHLVGVAETMEVLKSESSMVGLYDRNIPGKALRIITTLTLRKEGV